MNRIVLFLMTEKGLEVLRRITETDKSLIDYIVVGTDSHVEKDFSEEIISLAKESDIRHFLKGSEPSAPKDRYVFAISWRWMIEHPQDRLIVFHDSILPEYRGFAPLVNMLIKGENQIGVSAVFGADEYDRGDVIAQSQSDIEYPMTIAEAISLNNQNYLRLVEGLISRIARGEALVGVPQNEAEATYSIWRDEDDYFIDWSKSAEEIKRLIDAVGPPYLGAKSLTSRGDTIRIERAEVVEDVTCELRHVGKVIFIRGGEPVVICGSGLLRITKAHRLEANEELNYLPMTSFRVRFV